MVVYSSIHYKFATTNLPCNLNNLRKNLKLVITQLCFIKNQLIYFQLRWYRISVLFPEMVRTILFLSSPLAPQGEVPKTLPLVRLATKKILVSVDAVVGRELIATTLPDKHMTAVLPNCVLFRCSQSLESLVTDIAEVNPFSLMSLSYHTDPIQQLHHKPPLTSSGPGASR